MVAADSGAFWDRWRALSQVGGRTGDDLRAGRARQVVHADCFGNEALQDV